MPRTPSSASSVPAAAHIVQRHIHVLDGEPDRSLGIKDLNIVRVVCQQTRPGSVCKTFHVGLPAGAQVRLLRQKLKPHVHAGTVVLADHPSQPGLLLLLQDIDFVPKKVTLSMYDGVVTYDMVLTRHQCSNVQQLLRLVLEEPEVQKMLDKFEQDAAGAEHKYRWRLSALLQCEIYPSIAQHFGLEERGETTLPVHAVGNHSATSVQLTENWVILETLMRNKDMVAMAWAQLAHLRSHDEPQPVADSAFPEEPDDPTARLAGPLPPLGRGAGGASAAPDQGGWRGAWLLASAVQDGEGLLAAELRLSELLEQEEVPRRERFAQRAAVRLKLGLYDAALSDAIAAEGADGATAAYVAAKTGLQQYDDALNAGGRDDSLGEDVRSHIELLRRQSRGIMDSERAYWNPSAPALLPRTAEYLGPVKLGLQGQAGSRRRCLFATRVVEPGELLMSSCALVDMRAADGKSFEQSPAVGKVRESTLAACGVYRRAAQISRHASRILGAALSDGCFRAVLPMQELFWFGDSEGSSVAVDDAVIQGVVCTNGFKDLDDSLFPAASMANHSCIPNAVVVKLGTTFLLRARRRIESGEEVTINYFDIMMPVADRAERCKSWHFTCICRRCEAEKKVPKSRMFVPTAMQKQLAGMRSVPMGTSNVCDVIEKLEAAVHFLYGRDSDESMWVFASFVSLYLSQAEAAESGEQWDKLLKIFEVVHPGSFLHCKLSLNRWRRARTDAEYESYAPAAWQQCVEAHRLRYGGFAKDTLLRLMEATRRSVDEGLDEFCMD